MYDYLLRHFGPRAAAILTAAWYALLVLLVLYCAFEPQTELTYLML